MRSDINSARSEGPVLARAGTNLCTLEPRDTTRKEYIKCLQKTTKSELKRFEEMLERGEDSLPQAKEQAEVVYRLLISLVDNGDRVPCFKHKELNTMNEQPKPKKLLAR